MSFRPSSLRSAVSLAGPLTLALIIASAVGIGVYQFVYLPVVGAEVEVSEEILNPAGEVTVRIVEGAFDINQEENYVPKEVTVTLGVDNRVVWINDDPILHTVTTDPGSPEEGFAEAASRANFLDLGEEFIFTFILPGEYKYHCEPHPWMRATIIVVAPEGA